MRIGVIEDHIEVLNYLTVVLENAQHTVYPHMSGASLLNRLFVEHEKGLPPPYDLLLLDLWLPGGPSGMEILEYVRQDFPAQTLPVLVISSASGLQLERLTQRYQGLRVLRKPFRVQDLLQSIDAYRKDSPQIH